MAIRYVALGPLLSEEGSRAFLGLRVVDGVTSPCALVWVPEALTLETEQVALLRRDTDRAAALQHPNILQVYGLIELDEGLARAVEFADAESLRRILKVATRLPAPIAARIVADASLGVQYAHLAGNEDGTPLVHGDLRPDTLLISYAGTTKVSGYGALAVAPKEMTGRRVVGRRTHSAPEQILGGRGAVSAQTDVYLLGALLYELLTGEFPFQGEKNFDKAVVSKQPLLLEYMRVPPELRPVIGKSMAKKGALRYQTVQAFREALEQAAERIAERAELAAFLEQCFKEDGSRAARRREIERGILEWGTGIAAPAAPPVPVPTAAPAPAPAANPVSAPATRTDPAWPSSPAIAPPAAAPPPEPAQEAARPAAPPEPSRRADPPPSARRQALDRDLDEAPSDPRDASMRRPRTGPPWILAVALVVAAAAAAYWWGRHGERSRRERVEQAAQHAAVPVAAAEPGAPLAGAVSSAPAPTPAPPPAPAAAPTPAPHAAASAGAAREPSPTAPPSPGAEKDPAREADTPGAASGAATLEVLTTPSLTVSVDGKVVGRAPLSTAVAPGRHRLTLVDPAQGIQLVRAIQAKPGPNKLAFTVGRGSVTVHAPPGCQVRIDGRVVGQTPIDGAIPVFEGSHRIQVSLGSAVWQQAFSLAENEEMRFDVETEAREPP